MLFAGAQRGLFENGKIATNDQVRSNGRRIQSRCRTASGGCRCPGRHKTDQDQRKKREAGRLPVGPCSRGSAL